MAARLTSLLPLRARRRVQQMVGIADLQARVAGLEDECRRLETQLHESREESWERSRERWRAARPDADLTWGVELKGDEFIERAAAHGAFGAGRSVLEIGPGYGRLLRSALDGGRQFSSWLGLDLSETNVAHLSGAFEDERVEFRTGDAESAELDEGIDTVLSSLTFKHMFPSFEGLLTNVAPRLSSGGLVVFDLIEGDRHYFEADGVTYIRHYPRAEIEQILQRSGLDLVAFDQVRHHPDMARLLVVARRP